MGWAFWQFVGALFVIGFVGAYFWRIVAALAAGYVACRRVVLRALMAGDERKNSTPK